MLSDPQPIVLHPYEGISAAGLGEANFGMTTAEIQSVLGTGRPFRRQPDWPVELYYDSPLSMRFVFDTDGMCEFIEFNSPRRFPPVIDGQPVRGPTLRQAVEVLLALSYEPDDGALEDLRAGHLGQKTSGSDSVDFPSIGLSVWTSLSTETDEGGEFGEHVLDSVSLWRRGYWPDYGNSRSTA